MSHVKFADDTKTALDILLLPFGGPFPGNRDAAGEYFSAKTNFCLDWYPDRRPLLYHHGLDDGTKTVPVGYIEPGVTFTEVGGWVRAQLDRRNAYYSAIVDLIDHDGVGASSGAMAHLVKVAKSGHIDQWPLVEGSLTPTECNPLAKVDYATAKAHFKAAGLPESALKALALEDADGDEDGDQDAYPCQACREGDESSCACVGCRGGGECVCCAMLAQAGMSAGADPDLDDDAAKSWPNAYYLHRAAGKGYGLYRDATGTVDGRLLAKAIVAVEAADLPEGDKLAAIASARAIARAHGLRPANGLLAPAAEGAKATWTTAYVNDLNDGAFLYVEDGGKKDSAGKTTPRSLRHFPYKDKDGKVDLPHLRNALARIPQSSLPDDIKQRVAAKARRIAKANGIEAEAAKAMVDVLDILAHGDPEAAEGDYEGCYEDLIDDLRALLNPSNPWAEGGYTSILRTYPSYVICRRYQGDEETYWRIPYRLDAVGEPVLGDPIQVEQTYVPAKAFVDAGPIALDAHSLAQHASALAQRTKDLHDERTKQGRVFSTTNVKELTASAEQSIAAGQKILALIESSVRREQEAAKAAALATPEARERLLRLLEMAAS